MDKLSSKDLVMVWYHHNPQKQFDNIADNRLFRMLYNSYCRRNGISSSFDDLSDDRAYYKACSQLFHWYQSRYAVGFQMPTGTKGQKRSVNCFSEEYSFDLLYCDDRQFKNYLLTGTPQSGSQDLFSFVLHTAVAFLVPPGELDTVLQSLGFHPLHVKNIHHLAICYVLLTKENKPVAEDFNPFAEIKSLYFTAHGILSSPETVPEGGYSFADQETRMIRESLVLNRKLLSENFEQLVSLNKGALNTRHSMILADFHKLIAVFLNLFDTPTADSDKEHSRELPEELYSFYSFVVRFCKEELSRKKYREQVTGMIDRHGKHPTRNILILLWLHAYCFSCISGVYMEKTSFQRIVRQLKKAHPALAETAKDYYYCNYFDVYGFLMETGPRTTAQTFRGSDIIAAINEKLQLRYGWGPLNPRMSFDYYVLQLAELDIFLDSYSQYNTVRHDTGTLSDVPADVDNVPYPLTVITQLYSLLSAQIAERSVLKKSNKISPFPLKCSLYEQI